jgi:class 3 adenylate cyclase
VASRTRIGRGSAGLRRAARDQSSERFRRVVTILFSDVVDSTGLGERLDPETLDQVLTECIEGVGRSSTGTAG